MNRKDSLPKRREKSGFVFEYIHGGGWDKTEKLLEITKRSKEKPDAIFLKQCAAYFPGNLLQLKESMVNWIKICVDSRIMPVPTTVVPVTRLHSFKKFGIDIIKGRNPFSFGNPFKHLRNKSIIEYNEWI